MFEGEHKVRPYNVVTSTIPFGRNHDQGPKSLDVGVTPVVQHEHNSKCGTYFLGFPKVLQFQESSFHQWVHFCNGIKCLLITNPTFPPTVYFYAPLRYHPGQ